MPPDRRAKPDPLALPVYRVLQGPKGQLEHRALMGLLVILDHLGRLDPKDHKGRQVPKEP